MDIDDDLEEYNITYEIRAYGSIKVTKAQICSWFDVKNPSEVGEEEFKDYLYDSIDLYDILDLEIENWDY